MNRRIIITIIIASLLFSSCATHALWRDAGYKESLKDFYLSIDGKTLIIIGTQYHYIFPVRRNLNEILLSKKRIYIKPQFYTFSLNNDNSIEGKYVLHYDTLGSKNHHQWLIEHDFVQQPFETHKYRRTELLKGQRYLASNLLPNNRFRSEYTIEIEDSDYKHDGISRILLSPLTVAVDGTLLLGTVSIVALSILRPNQINIPDHMPDIIDGVVELLHYQSLKSNSSPRLLEDSPEE